MSRSVHSVKLTPYNSSQLSSLTYTLGDVVFDQDNLTLRVMDGNTFGGATIANQSWTQNYINTVFSQAVITVGNITNSTGTYPSGALRIAGGVSIKKDTYMDGSLTVNTNLTVTGNLNATVTTSAQPNINSLGTLTGLTSSGAVSITNNTQSTALGTGALQVSGGVSIAKDLYVGGKLFLTDSQLNIAGATFSNGVIVSGSTSPFTEYFTVTDGAGTPVTKFQIDTATGNTTIAGTLDTTGTFQVNTNKFVVNGTTGNTTIAGTLNVTGLITGPGLGVTISATAPPSPVAGNLWYNSTSGNLYVYYVDANGGNWVQPAESNQQASFTLPNASSSVLGGVIVPLVGTSGITNTNGTIRLATASTTQIGGITIDGTTITKNANGQIQYVIPTATTSTIGGVTIPAVSTSGITNTGGAIGIATATNTQIGGVKVDGSTVTINGSGVISAPYSYTLPTASNITLGGVKIDASTVTTNGQGQLTIPAITLGSTVLYPGSTMSALDSVVIGAITPAAATFTSITVAGETITGFTDIYDFDDISYYVDGFTNTFALTFNQSPVALASPFNIIVAIDGAVQPAFDLGYELVWGSDILPASKGYTVDINGNLQFAECPSMGSQIQVRSSVSVSPTPHTKKVYPFKALDIMMGF